MSSKIDSDLVELKILSSALNQKNLSTLTYQKLQKITFLLWEKLPALERHVKEGFSPLMQPLRQKILKTLNKINEKLAHLFMQNEKIQLIKTEALNSLVYLNEVEYLRKAPSIIRFVDNLYNINVLKDRIEQTQLFTEQAPKLENKKINSWKVSLPLILFLGADQNGALAHHLYWTIKEQVPFLVSRRTLNSLDVREDHPMAMVELTSKVRLLLLKDQRIWDVYTLKEFLLFLPKTFLSEKSENERLEELDFKSDGSLKKISILEALEEPCKNNNLTDFYGMFSDNPKRYKVFYVVGHGNSKYIAALNSNEYQEFLAFAEKQFCKFLCISSCQAGGQIPAGGQTFPETSLPGFWDQEPSNHVITTVRSIGDMSTYAEQEAEKKAGLFLQEISKFLEDTKPFIKSNFRKIVEKNEEKKEKKAANLMKIYFPHRGGVPSGFRPLNEKNKGFSLTYITIKKAEISKKYLEIISNASFLNVFPLISKISLKFENNNPILLSMIPGNARHYFKKVILVGNYNEDIIDFLYKIIHFYKENPLESTSKAFFISELVHEVITGISHEIKTINDLTIYIKEADTYCVWRKKKKYFFMKNLPQPQLISPLFHAAIAQEAINETIPSLEALRASSGGQEKNSSFDKKLDKCGFFSPCVPLIFYQDDDIFYKNLESFQPTLEEKKIIIFLLLSHEREELALELLKIYKLNPDMKYITDGKPLLSFAIQYRALKMIKYLLNHAASLFIADSDGFFPLHYAVINIAAHLKLNDRSSQIYKDNKMILDLLLERDIIDVNMHQSGKWPPIYYALPHRELVNKLIQKGAKINYEDQINKFSLLSYAIFSNNRETVQLLLELKADPNLGSPSALTEAIYKNNISLVRLLLQAGGAPFVRNLNGKIPFIEAVLRASPDIVSLLLEHHSFDINLSDADRITPLLAAYFSGNQKKIQLLRERNASFPFFNMLSRNLKKMIKLIIYRLFSIHDLKTLLEFIPNISNVIKLNKFTWNFILRTRDVALLDKLIQKKIISLKKVNLKGYTFFDLICSKAAKNFDEFHKLLEFCLTHGVVPHFIDFIKALNSKNIRLISLLLENSSFIELKNSHEIFSRLVTLGNLELIKLAINQGINIHCDPLGRHLHPLENAARNIKSEQTKEVFKWLAQCYDKVDIIAPQALTTIIENGHLDLLDFCFENWNVLRNSNSHREVLTSAVKSGKIEMLDSVLQKGLQLSNQIILEQKLLSIGYHTGRKEMLAKLLPFVEDSPPLEDLDLKWLWELVISQKDRESLKLLLDKKVPFISSQGINFFYESHEEWEELKLLY